MELAVSILLLELVIIVILFVVEPFSEQWRAKAQGGHEISSLLAKRENALDALQELDFDFTLGKIPPEEYSAQRASLVQMGAEAMRRLDEIQTTSLAPSEAPVEPAAVKPPVKPLADEDLEELIAKRRAARQQKPAGFCPKCGKPILQSDRFCPSCGQAVNSSQSQLQ